MCPLNMTMQYRPLLTETIGGMSYRDVGIRSIQDHFFMMRSVLGYDEHYTKDSLRG